MLWQPALLKDPAGTPFLRAVMLTPVSCSSWVLMFSPPNMLLGISIGYCIVHEMLFIPVWWPCVQWNSCCISLQRAAFQGWIQWSTQMVGNKRDCTHTNRICCTLDQKKIPVMLTWLDSPGYSAQVISHSNRKWNPLIGSCSVAKHHFFPLLPITPVHVQTSFGASASSIPRLALHLAGTAPYQSPKVFVLPWVFRDVRHRHERNHREHRTDFFGMQNYFIAASVSPLQIIHLHNK